MFQVYPTAGNQGCNGVTFGIPHLFHSRDFPFPFQIIQCMSSVKFPFISGKYLPFLVIPIRAIALQLNGNMYQSDACQHDK